MTDLAKSFECLTNECMRLNKDIFELIRIQGTDMYAGHLVKQYSVISKQREQLLKLILSQAKKEDKP